MLIPNTELRAKEITKSFFIKKLRIKFPNLTIEDRGTRVVIWGQCDNDTFLDLIMLNNYKSDLEFSYKALNKKEKPARINVYIDLSKDVDECIEIFENALMCIRRYNNYLSVQESKRKQINSLNDIVIHGLMNKYPMVKKAFDARNRNAKNFCRKAFKKDKLVINAKFTISNTAKLDKIFEALEEALKED